MAQAKKKTSNKSVIGGLKSESKLKLGFLLIAAVLLITTIGYVGYSKYRENSLKAHASAGTFIASAAIPGGSALAYGCRTTVNTAFGQLYRVQITYILSGSFGNSNYYAGVSVFRPTNRQIVANGSSTSWWSGSASAVSTYASPAYGDTISGAVSYLPTATGRQIFSGYNPGRLGSC